MEWFKKNWKWVAVAVIVLIVVLYFINKKRVAAGKEKISLVPGASARRARKKEAEKKEKIGTLETKLNLCQESTKAVRLKAGAVHPCEPIKKQLSALKGNSESSYMSPWHKAKGLNIIDFSMGQDGLALYEDKQLGQESGFLFSGCKDGEYPNPTTGQCGETWTWDQMPKGTR